MQQKFDTREKEFNVARKLLTNADFTELHSQLNRFNVFSAFRHNEKETKHTNLLCYLLDPHGTHGLGDVFLRNVLLGFCEMPDDQSKKLIDGLFGTTMLDIDATNVKPQVPITAEMQKTVEKGYVDIKVEIPYRDQNKDSFHIIIEMKLKARQGIGQLDRYSECYKDIKNKILVYLTPYGNENISDKWLNVTYGDLILPALKSTINAFEEKLDQEILGLLKNFQEVLESFTTEKDSVRAGIVEKILKEIDAKKIDLSGVKKLPVMRPYQRAIAELEAKAVIIESAPLLTKFKEWCKTKKHREYSSNEGYMRFLPSCLSDDEFISANKNLAGRYNEKPWTEEPAALLFEIARTRKADDESTENNNVEVRCKIVLGPLNEGIDRGDYRTKLMEKLGTNPNRKLTDSFSTIESIGKSEKFEDKIKTIDDWLEENENKNKLKEIKRLTTETATGTQ